MKTFSADKKGEQKNQSARAEVSQSDAPIRRRQIRCSADGLEKQAGNSNVESELGQSLADIKVDKADFRGKESESDEKKITEKRAKNSEDRGRSEEILLNSLSRFQFRITWASDGRQTISSSRKQFGSTPKCRVRQNPQSK